MNNNNDNDENIGLHDPKKAIFKISAMENDDKTK